MCVNCEVIIKVFRHISLERSILLTKEIFPSGQLLYDVVKLQPTSVIICKKKEKEIVAFIHIIFSIAHKKYFRNNFKNSMRILFLIQKETNGTFANFDNFTRQSSVTKIMTLSSIVRTRNLWFGGKKLHKGKNRICSSVQAWKWFVISFHTK